MTGIIGAMSVEVEKITAAMENRSVRRISGIEFTSGTLHGREVVTAVCGIGKVFAAVCAQTMILRYAPARIINTGVAGSLSGKLHIGDLAVSDFVVQHDMDTSALGDPVGMISGINLVRLPADPGLGELLCRCARDAGLNCLTGTIASGDRFLSDPGKKAWIADTFGAVACEMEGAAVGQACYINRVPFCVIRAISDNADGESGMDFMSFTKMAAENSAAVIGRLIKAQ